jgi:hypothetical protein
VLPLLAGLAAAASSGGATGSRALTFAPLRSGATLQVTTNWSGYAVTSPSTTYTSVTATWRQPRVTCTAADAGSSSAFWVGLGGYAETSQALEQAGTSSDCDRDTGRATYYAWYELLPDPSVTVSTLKVLAGDVITTSVNAVDGGILMQIKNRTRHTTFTKKLAFASPDLTSAEWIAEAPSSCSSADRCVPIPLSNFGSVSFERIAALGNGVGGTLLVNPGWSTIPIQLVPTSGRGFFPGRFRFGGASSSTAGAAPDPASADGRSFVVRWSANATAGS